MGHMTRIIVRTRWDSETSCSMEKPGHLHGTRYKTLARTAVKACMGLGPWQIHITL